MVFRSAYNEYQGDARVDWQRTQSDTMFFRYFITDYNLKANYQQGNLLSAAAPGLLDRVQTLTAGDTYLLSSSMVNSFRATYSRSAIQRVGADGVPNLTQLGSNTYSPIQNYMGQFQVSGYFNMNAIPGWVYTNIWTLTDDISMVRGSHQIGIGGNWVHTQDERHRSVPAKSPHDFQRHRFRRHGLHRQRFGGFMTGYIGTILQGNGQVSDATLPTFRQSTPRTTGR